MASAILLRTQLEASLADRIPGAFTPKFRQAPETLPTGIQEVDVLLEGGVPRSGITEIVGGSERDINALSGAERAGVELVGPERGLWVRPAHDGLRAFIEKDGRTWDETY